MTPYGIPGFRPTSLRLPALVIGMFCIASSHAGELLTVMPDPEESSVWAVADEAWVPLADQQLAQSSVQAVADEAWAPLDEQQLEEPSILVVADGQRVSLADQQFDEASLQAVADAEQVPPEGQQCVESSVHAAADEALTSLSDRQLEQSSDQPVADEAWAPLADKRLEQLRGGFDSGEGLVVSFGIERAVYVNGVLVTTTALNVGTLSPAIIQSGQTIPIASGVPGTVSLVQNGQANIFQVAASAGAALPATFIQNTLNNQTISAMTVINAATNSLSALKTLNVNGTLLNAVSAAVGSR